MVFYANIMWANKSTLLSADSHSLAIYIIQVPLAWLNLEFGFETCFIRGMDALGKMWFHFGQDFLYIFAVTSVIIISSRYSTFATKLLGNNSVPVLATIVFLSYTKLLQTIIDTLSFTVLKSGNETYIVWSLDGNVPFFGVHHAILFGIAFLSFSLSWLPYTVVLLFGQCLRKKTRFLLLRWIDKQKLYFDAYFGPFKDEYHYWFGLLLVARSALLIVNAVSFTAPQVNLFAIVVVGVGLLVHPYQYKNWIRSLIDKLSCANLIIVACGVLYCDLNGFDQLPIVLASTIFFLGILLLIMGYRAFIGIQKCFKKRAHSHYGRSYNDIDAIQHEEANQQDDNNMYREPLLDLGSHSKRYSIN